VGTIPCCRGRDASSSLEFFVRNSFQSSRRRYTPLGFLRAFSDVNSKDATGRDQLHARSSTIDAGPRNYPSSPPSLPLTPSSHGSVVSCLFLLEYLARVRRVSRPRVLFLGFINSPPSPRARARARAGGGRGRGRRGNEARKHGTRARAIHTAIIHNEHFSSNIRTSSRTSLSLSLSLSLSFPRCSPFQVTAWPAINSNAARGIVRVRQCASEQERA